MRLKKLKIKKETYYKFKEVNSMLRDVGFDSSYNTKFYRLIFDNIKTIEGVNKKIRALNMPRKGDAIKYNNRNYIVDQVFLDYNDIDECIFMRSLKTICGDILHQSQLRQTKQLK